MTKIPLLSPVTGPTLAIERVPDPVFAQKLVGDGVAVDPLEPRVVSPCDGIVAQFHPAGHAVTVRHASGVECLVHVGLDTVRLRGEGFRPLAGAGDAVKAGQPLLAFDLDLLAGKARSLLTLVVVVAGDAVEGVEAHPGDARAGVTPLLTVTMREGAVTRGPESRRFSP